MFKIADDSTLQYFRDEFARMSSLNIFGVIQDFQREIVDTDQDKYVLTQNGSAIRVAREELRGR